MFKSKSKDRPIFAKRRQKRRPGFSWFWTVISILLSLLVLELLTRIAVDIAGRRDEFAQAKAQPDLLAAYQLKFVDEVGDVYEEFADSGSLVAQRSLSVGYKLQGTQTNQYWQINDRGFRDRDPVAVTKPQDEVRIFILGGSTAFGYGSSGNEATISELLETRLQQRLLQQQSSPQLYKPDTLPRDPDKRAKAIAKPSKIKQGKYRVVNAAVPGYASGNQLAQLALEILKYKPDLVIIIDGYSDLMLPGNEKAIDLSQLERHLRTQATTTRSYISRTLEPLADKSYVVKIVQDKWLDVPEGEEKTNFILSEQNHQLIQYLPPNEAELATRVERYSQHQKQILSLAAASRIPLILASQPEITGRNPSKLTSAEGDIATELGRSYIKKVKQSYPNFVEVNQQLAKSFPQNVRAVDLYNLNDKYPVPSFIDAIHLTDEANKQVAEQLYYAIASFSKMQVKPKEPPKPVNPVKTSGVQNRQ